MESVGSSLLSLILMNHRLTWDLNGCQDSGALNSANNSLYLYQRNKIYGLINNQVEPFNLVSALCYHSSNNWWGCKDPNKHCYWPLRRIWGAECITIIINTRCFLSCVRWNPVFWVCLCQCPLPRIGQGGQLICARKIRSVMRKIKVHCAWMSLSLWML